MSTGPSTLSIDLNDALQLRLIERGLIKVNGETVEKFLQGLLTCDVRTVKANSSLPLPSRSCLGAHCNPKGRIIFTFRLFYCDDNYFLSLPKTQVECAMQALKKYAAFSKVSIENISEEVSLRTLAALNPSPLAADFEHWKLKDIEAGIAEIYPETREQFTPHELNYHKLNAISFDKGCYIGQEIVARMHYLGKLKTELVLAEMTAETTPTRGEKIFYGEKSSPQLAGYLVDFAAATHHYKLLVSLYTSRKQVRGIFSLSLQDILML